MTSSALKKRKRPPPEGDDLTFRGADERTRTADLRITSALLYQLSHIGTLHFLNASENYSGSLPFRLEKLSFIKKSKLRNKLHDGTGWATRTRT